MVLKAYAVPYLVAVVPDDPESRMQIDTLIAMVTEWSKIPKPKLAKRAQRMLVKLTAIREAAITLQVVPASTPERTFDQVLRGTIEMAKFWKQSKRGLSTAHIRSLELFTECIVA